MDIDVHSIGQAQMALLYWNLLFTSLQRSATQEQHSKAPSRIKKQMKRSEFERQTASTPLPASSPPQHSPSWAYLAMQACLMHPKRKPPTMSPSPMNKGISTLSRYRILRRGSPSRKLGQTGVDSIVLRSPLRSSFNLVKVGICGRQSTIVWPHPLL